MLRLLFYVIFVVSCIVGIQADESTNERSIQDLVDAEIRNSMTRRSNRVEDKLRVLNDDKHASKLWDIYKDYFNQTYSTPEEDEKRSKIFIKNLRLITKTNDPFHSKANSFTVGLNQFSGMNSEEIIRNYCGGLPDEQSETSENAKPFFNSDSLPATRRTILPKFLDHCQYMNPIESQGGCSSCYAFASTATIEGTYAFKKKHNITLSKQEIIDCASQNQCQPWYVTKTMEYIKNHHGLRSAQTYPYKGIQNACSAKLKKMGPIKDYVRIQPGDEEAMKLALYTFGPLTAFIAVTPSFERYTSRILDVPSCSKAVNHVIVIVGYGTEVGQDYWLCRNSWGVNWGIKGYFKIARNKGNMCGIASEVHYVTV